LAERHHAELNIEHGDAEAAQCDDDDPGEGLEPIGRRQIWNGDSDRNCQNDADSQLLPQRVRRLMARCHGSKLVHAAQCQPAALINQIVVADDSLIVKVIVEKKFGVDPKLVLLIEPIDALASNMGGQQ
jgi:hypothetical protein